MLVTVSDLDLSAILHSQFPSSFIKQECHCTSVFTFQFLLCYTYTDHFYISIFTLLHTLLHLHRPFLHFNFYFVTLTQTKATTRRTQGQGTPCPISALLIHLVSTSRTTRPALTLASFCVPRIFKNFFLTHFCSIKSINTDLHV